MSASAQSINPTLNQESQIEAPIFTDRFGAAEGIMENETFQDITYYGIELNKFVLAEDMKTRAGTNLDTNLSNHEAALNRLGQAIEAFQGQDDESVEARMPFLEDRAGFINGRGDTVGYVKYGKQPDSAFPQEQLTLEVRMVNHEEQRTLGLSAEKITLGERSQVACQIDIVSAMHAINAWEGKGKFQKGIVTISDEIGLRIELDDQGNVIGLRGITFRGNTPYTAELPYNGNSGMKLDHLIPHLQYINAPKERNNEDKKKKRA